MLHQMTVQCHPCRDYTVQTENAVIFVVAEIGFSANIQCVQWLQRLCKFRSITRYNHGDHT